jgi:hypothetical protein
LQFGEQGTFGFDGLASRPVLDAGDKRERCRVVMPAFDDDGALASRWQKYQWVETLSDLVTEVESFQPCASEDYRIKFALEYITQASIDISTQRDDLQVWAQEE